MSGGALDYTYQDVFMLADTIEEKMKADEIFGEDIGIMPASKQRKVTREIQQLIADLRLAGLRAKSLEWYMSGDTGIESYLEDIEKFRNSK